MIKEYIANQLKEDQLSQQMTMEDLFCGCEELTELKIKDWNVSKVKNMSSLFQSCKKMKKCDPCKTQQTVQPCDPCNKVQQPCDPCDKLQQMNK